MSAFALCLVLLSTPTREPAQDACIDAAEIERLIEQLGNDEFMKRQAAGKRLEDIGEPAFDALSKAAASSDDPEIRRRAEKLVRAIGKRMFAVVRRIGWQDTVQGIPAHIYHSAFSPDGRTYLAGGDIGPLRLWDVATGKQVQEFKGHVGWTSSAVFTPDGKRLLSSGTDKLVRLWDVATGREIRRFVGHTEAVHAVAVSPDGRVALSGSHDKTLRLWDLETGQEVRRMEGHAGWCVGVFSPDGKQALSFSAEKTLRLWDVATGKQIRLFEGHTNEVCGAFFTPGGRQVLSYSTDNTLRAWNVASGKEVRQLKLGDNHCAIRWLAVTSDGRRFLTNHQDQTVRLHDVATGREIHRFDVPPDASPQGLSISPDGRYAADGSFRGFVYLFRLAGEERPRE